MAPNSVLSTLRQIIRELRHSCRKNENVRDLEMYKYTLEQFRKYQVTDKKLCKSQEEMKYLAETYLIYLQSVKEYGEIYDKYHGRGERSTAEAAALVGLNLPKTYQDAENNVF
uniref:Protein FMC1 homolog n=1 Tax=Strigamia maritima TaxID=126957 RepID=T1IUZ4_STRMM